MQLGIIGIGAVGAVGSATALAPAWRARVREEKQGLERSAERLKETVRKYLA